MKILFLGGNFNLPGGTERVASLVGDELSQLGYGVILASIQGGDRPFFRVNNRVQYRSLFSSVGRNILRGPAIVWRVRNLLLSEKVDALVVVESMLCLYSVPAVVGLDTYHVCWEHFNYKIDLGRVGRRIARLLASRFCHAVVTLTEKDRHLWLTNSAPRARVISISNPCPFQVQYDHMPSPDSRIVLSVGRLVPQKGFDLLLSAWQYVCEKAPDWRLRIIGDGPDKASLVRLSHTLGVQDTVEFVPSTKCLARHYSEAGIFCLSSRFEGFGLVLVEAISFGIPVVSFDCEVGPAEILKGTGALLVEAGDVDGLGQSVLDLIVDPMQREHISGLSKSRAEEFQSKYVIEKWVQLFDQARHFDK